MNIGQALIVAILYGCVIVGGIIEFRQACARRNTADDSGTDETGADWSGEGGFINHGEGK